jgi:hypothetical protein
MATTTTRLGLTKPDFVDVVDISELNSNADDIDAAVGAAVVTSSTRPGTPWSGQLIYETDTERTLVWDGTVWEPVSSVAPGSITATELASNAVTTVKILNANVTRAKLATNLAAFTKSTTFTVSNATQGDFVHTSGSTFTVPSLGNNTIVKVTVIGAGGGGGGSGNQDADGANGGNGGTTTFNAGGAGSVSASGGNGGRGGKSGTGGAGVGASASPGNASGNGGGGGSGGSVRARNGNSGLGGSSTVSYLNLSGISTVSVSIGGGGSAGAGSGTSSAAGAVGGRGEVIVEYVLA